MKKNRLKNLHKEKNSPKTGVQCYQDDMRIQDTTSEEVINNFILNKRSDINGV